VPSTRKPPPAKRAANQGPVFITDRGRPAHPIADLLAMPGVEDLDLPLPHHRELARAADLA
jgi:hypothetical protein